MIKHKKVNRELLQKTLGENGIKATPTVRSGQTAKLVMTGEDGKVYEVNKDLTVVRVQDEMPARPLLKTHSQSPADRSAVQIRKAAMRTSKYEAVHQSIATHRGLEKSTAPAGKRGVVSGDNPRGAGRCRCHRKG